MHIDINLLDTAGVQLLDLFCGRNREAMPQEGGSQPGTVEPLDLHADFQLIDGYSFAHRNDLGRLAEGVQAEVFGAPAFGLNSFSLNP
jgi:hypothetical protein